MPDILEPSNREICDKMVSYTLQAELHECTGRKASLISAVSALFPFNFSLTCHSLSNNYQLVSDFDAAFGRAAQAAGWHPATLTTPDEFSRDHDGFFQHGDLRIAVEIEKTNWEKFLYDLLKCHVYVSSGANGCLILLPVNWPHSSGSKDIYHDCIPRLRIASEYDAIRTDVLESLVVVGFRQMYNGALFNSADRAQMRTDSQRQIGT